MRVREYVRLASRVFVVSVGLSAAIGIALVGQTASQTGTSPRTPGASPICRGFGPKSLTFRSSGRSTTGTASS